MGSPELKSIAIKLRNKNKSYGDIAGILGLSRQCVRNLVIYKCYCWHILSFYYYITRNLPHEFYQRKDMSPIFINLHLLDED